MAIQSFRDLDAWKCGMDVVVLAYRLTTRMPDSERFGLVTQMRRAAISIPSNIAEAHGRKPNPAVIGRGALYFINVALGSLNELDTQLEAALRLGFIERTETSPLNELLSRTRQLLFGMRRRALAQADTMLTARRPPRTTNREP